MDIWHAVIGVAGLACGLPLGFIALKSKGQRNLDRHIADERSKLDAERLTIIKETEDKARTRIEEHKHSLEQTLQRERDLVQQQSEGLKQLEGKLQRQQSSLSTRENALHEREDTLDAKRSAVDRREAKLLTREQELDGLSEQLTTRQQELDARVKAAEARITEIAEMSRDQARDELFTKLDEELAVEQAAVIKRRTEETEERAKSIATEFVSRAIQRYAAEHTAETTTSRVELNDEEMKGRIIGKEGRNIRAFEQQSGVDLIIDDTPGIITISCFDGIRREIARRALEELLLDGRIHPARIEEVMARTQQEMDRHVLKLGEDAAYEVDVSGLHPQLLKLLGKLQFRTSYGQNVLQHTKEVAYLSAAMAADLGLDPKLGRRCGLMHDIGKALDHEQEGSHPELGFEALKRYGENEIVANAALAHHEGHEVLSAYTTLTAAADAISAARPGARRENVERYIKRLQALEDIACSFKGVKKSYAIQAGRELRVIVNGHVLGDGTLPKTARSIARRIEDEVAYPGEVRVTVIRETRQTAVAR
ncbi:MAG: ribonuclease Y [Planctomycetota bacterium]|jgi:ribonuclease Y|nr:ribonuclease Y [Planctomycetota bacterium]